MYKTLKIILLSSCLLPLWTSAQIELFIVERTQTVVQTGPDTLVPFGDHSNFEFGGNYTSWLEISAAGETITNPSVATPNNGGGIALTFDADEESYLEEMDYVTEQEIASSIPAGTYTFTGTGSQTGAFSESITVGAYSPLTPLKIVNFEALQSYDPTQDVVIEWEPFTAAGGLSDGPNLGYYGLINVEVTGFRQDEVIDAWSSETITDPDAFGLVPTTTSVTIPSEALATDAVYIVNIGFIKIDTVSESSTGALKVGVTGYELEFDIYREGTAPVDTDWAGYVFDENGWINTNRWLGFLNVSNAPWVYSNSLNGWVYAREGDVTQSGGWVYVPR